MKKINKDEVYVLKQPKHLVGTVVIITGEFNEFPLSEEVHEKLNLLSKVTDLLFIYSDNKFPNTKKINKLKFANLYEATCFIDSEDNLGKTVFKLLDYSVNIFNKYNSFLFISNTCSSNFNFDDNITNLITETLGSTVIKPILKIRRLTSDEFFKTYIMPEDNNVLNDSKKSETYYNKILKLLIPNTSKLINEELIH